MAPECEGCGNPDHLYRVWVRPVGARRRVSTQLGTACQDCLDAMGQVLLDREAARGTHE
jgi:hypothetical protein